MSTSTKLAIASILSLFAGVTVGRFLEHRRKNPSLTSKEQGRGVGVPHPACGDCIYFDYNGTTPVFPEVADKIIHFVTHCFGNPSSSHAYGSVAREAVAEARAQVARLVGAAAPETIVFTSCGSESDNRAIDIALEHFQSSIKLTSTESIVPHIISCVVEHPAILLYLKHLEAKGAISLSLAPVTPEGFVEPSTVGHLLRAETALVTIMHSNNEVGTLQPIRAIAAEVKSFNAREKRAVLLHSDAAQSLGKVPVDVLSLGVDLLTIVAHKFGGPKGIAALYIREGVGMRPMLFGGGQEGGRRAGTENVAYIAGLGEAARLARDEAGALLLHMLTLKLRLLDGLQRAFAEDADPLLLRFNGPARSNDANAIASDLKVLCLILSNNRPPASSPVAADVLTHLLPFPASIGNVQLDQLPNTISVSFRNVQSDKVVAALQQKVACSQGSACHSHDYKLSAVLEAMSVPPEYGFGTLRLSLGRHTSEADVDRAIVYIAAAVRSCR